MKKETIFRHELNESIQANAAMNCLKNRNKPQLATQEQEEGADEKGTFALKLVKKFKNRMTPDYAKRPEMFMMLKLQNALKKPLMSLSKEEYHAWAKAICDACESVFGASQEQEEDYGMNDLRAWRNSLSLNGTGEVDNTNYDDDSVGIDMIANLLVADNKITMEEKESVKPHIKELLDYHGLWIGEDEHEAERFINLYWDNQEQEEHPEDADRVQSQLANAWDEGMDDDEDDYVPYENKFDETHHDIVDSILEEVYRYFQFEIDVEGFNLMEYTEEQIGKAIEQILDKTGDFPSSVNNNVCYAWVQKYAGKIIKILETGSLENPYEGHPEFEFSEQEELPSNQSHEMILALAEYMSESWIAADDEDFDDIYYAVADILKETGDYPASTSWEDCKPWCQTHYKEVEARIY